MEKTKKKKGSQSSFKWMDYFVIVQVDKILLDVVSMNTEIEIDVQVHGRNS